MSGAKILSHASILSNTSPKSFTDIIDVLYNLSLEEFCTKRLLEIELAIPLIPQDRTILKEIVEAGKKFEHLSGAYFITYEDVIDLIARLVQDNDSVQLPKLVREHVQEMVRMKPQELDFLSPNFLGLMTKLKIIESMYQTYLLEISKMKRRHQVHEDLTALLQNCEANEVINKTVKKEKKGTKKDTKEGKKKNKKPDQAKKTGKNDSKKKDTSRESEKKQSARKEIIDDTDIILEENELIFDYNVDNQVLYFILSGFPDIHFLQMLSKLQIQISAIIDVSSDISSLREVDGRIVQLHELFETPNKSAYLENTAWMKCRIEDKCSSKEKLETFLDVVKKINYIKRQHLSYITDLKLYNFGETPKKLDSECLEKYNRILNRYPSELMNVPLIVSALVEEICWREAGSIYSLSDLTTSSNTDDIVWEGPKSYQTHEEDVLKMEMRSYKEIGRKCYDESLAYLKFLQPFSKFDLCSNVQFRDRAVSTEDSCYCDDQKELFDYFHLVIFDLMKRHLFVPKEPQESHLTSYLVTYNQVKEYQEALPKGNILCGEEANNFIQDYHIKEDLSTSVLRQLIFKAIKHYSYWDRMYCNDSRAILLRFHDNLDKFGLDTRIWWQNVRTPVCLRDFCRFVADEENQWLQKHKLVEHEFLIETDDNEEKCEGLKEMDISELYQEYQYLLDSETTGISHEEKKKIFDEIMTELLNYPKSNSLTPYCNNNGSLIAYDLGSSRCQLTGHTTIFHSDDDVRVTIDNSRFKTEDPKCVIIIDADDNSLVYHNAGASKFHFIFRDETIVNFKELKTYCKENLSNSEVTEDQLSHKSIEEPETQEPRVPNYSDYWVQVLRMSKIPTIPSLKQSIQNKKIYLDDTNLERLLELFKAAVYDNEPIYKISTKPSLYHLRRTTSPAYLPLARILKRVLFKPIRRKRRIGGYSVLSITKTKKEVPLKYDFEVTLPNGLVITTLPRNKKLVEVRQEYKYNYYNEQYRIMYSNGVIVIKNSDGTNTILRSNGDIIRLTDQSECSSVNYAKNTTHLFQNEESEFCPFQTTRCNPTSKFTTLPDLYEFGDIPYSKKSLLQFDGKRIDVSEDNIKEKQQYYVLSQHDYHAEEVFYEREDGMKCIVDKKYNQIFQFPDGTKITASLEVEKELIYVSKNPNTEGWVSVVINYKYEHPDYLTVRYDGTDGSTQIFLKDGIIKNTNDSFLMSVDKDLALEVTSDSIVYLKTCPSCEGDCVCKIHLDNGPKLLEVNDTYDKYLTCDHFGKCDISPSVIKTSMNKNKCDHRWKNEKQKLFVLNERGPAGTLFWKDSSVHNKIMTSKNCKNIRMSNFVNKLIKKPVLEFFTEIYQNFVGRFTMRQIYNRNICLSKYKTCNDIQKPQFFYVTYRILIEFQNLAEYPEIITELKKFCERRAGRGSSGLLVEGIKGLLTCISRRVYDFKEDKLSYRLSMMEGLRTSSSSSATKSSDPEKPTVTEIIAKWKRSCDEYRYLIRNNKIPPYFQSEYFHQLQGASKR